MRGREHTCGNTTKEKTLITEEGATPLAERVCNGSLFFEVLPPLRFIGRTERASYYLKSFTDLYTALQNWGVGPHARPVPAPDAVAN